MFGLRTREQPETVGGDLLVVLRGMADSLRFGFVFPMATGHLNPSLPIAAALRELKHEVHYLSRDEMRPMIEKTGGKRVEEECGKKNCCHPKARAIALGSILDQVRLHTCESHLSSTPPRCFARFVIPRASPV